MGRYVAELQAAKESPDRCCVIADNGGSATVIYRDGWIVVDHTDNAIHACDGLALVTLDETADAEQLDRVALAADLEGSPLWLIDARQFDELGSYGQSLTVLWRG